MQDSENGRVVTIGLLVPWRFYAWHPHHTSRDRSRILRMMLFINNTKNTFYETKVLKTKHVSFLKYNNALLIFYRTFGPVSLRNLPVQHEIYRSWSVGPMPISTTVHVINNLMVFKQHIQQFKGTNDVLQQVNLKF